MASHDHGPDETMARRRFVRRATAAGVVAWSAPVVLSATAGAQGSVEPPPVCIRVPHTLAWNDVATGAFTSATVDGITMTASWTPTVSPPFNAADFPNQTVEAPQQGGTGTRYLRYVMSPENTGGGQAIRFTFSEPVRDVSFTVLDIDNSTILFQGGTIGWSDRVTVQTSPFSYTPAPGATLTGDGTSGDPFANTSPNNVANGSSLGNLRLTFPGPLTTVDFTYTNGPITGGGNQLIGIGNVTFDTCAPTP